MSIFSFQSLLLLNYLLKNASENVVLKTREHLLDDLRSLATYSCFDERGRDQGEQIRLKAKEIIDFIQLDDESLMKERRKEKEESRKYIGFSNEGQFGRKKHFGGDSLYLHSPTGLKLLDGERRGREQETITVQPPAAAVAAPDHPIRPRTHQSSTGQIGKKFVRGRLNDSVRQVRFTATFDC